MIPEATCAAMILEDWERFMEKNPNYKQRIQKLLPKIHMATHWLMHNTNLKEYLSTLAKLQETFTYHDPCHARKVLGIWKEPRELLCQNYNLIEMEDSNACCGFGGVTMQTEKFNLASKVGNKKAQMINKTQAKYVVAECSACRMQLNNALHQEKVKTLFAHPLELIQKIIKANFIQPMC